MKKRETRKKMKERAGKKENEKEKMKKKKVKRFGGVSEKKRVFWVF